MKTKTVFLERNGKTVEVKIPEEVKKYIIACGRISGNGGGKK